MYYISLLGNTKQTFSLVSHWMSVNNKYFWPKIAASMILALRNSSSVMIIT